MKTLTVQTSKTTGFDFIPAKDVKKVVDDLQKIVLKLEKSDNKDCEEYSVTAIAFPKSINIGDLREEICQILEKYICSYHAEKLADRIIKLGKSKRRIE